MTLREIFNGILNFFGNTFNKILDFDLTNTFLIFGILFYICFCTWFIMKGIFFIQGNFKKWNIYKKVGHISAYIIVILWIVVMPISLTIMD